jgi:N-acetylglucosaminyldiphosphoundecaprenol N-acetyl-beta-D-mannosaminyltransferase
MINSCRTTTSELPHQQVPSRFPDALKRRYVNVLGVRVAAISMLDATEAIDRWIANRENQYVCVTGVHGIMESWRDPSLKEIHNRAGLVTPDGMPLVWLCRALGVSKVERVYGPDLMLAVCENSVRNGYRNFFFGGASGIPEKLTTKLCDRFPGLIVAGTYSPPFRDVTSKEDAEIVEFIRETRPDIVWVGVSTPKQERWMAEHVHRFTGSLLIGVGAAFDIHSGVKPQAPAWMRRTGLEWLFRLSIEPRRLWKRYLINNPLFLLLVAWQFLCGRLREA